MINLNDSEQFPKLDDALLTGPTITSPYTAGGEPLRVVIDTDLDNEIDDFFALAHLAMAHNDKKITIEAIYAAPYSFRTRLETMLQAMDLLEQVDESQRTPEETALINAWEGQINAIEAQGDNPRIWGRFPPEGGPKGSYDHVSIGPATGMKRSYNAIKEFLPLLNLAEPAPPFFHGADQYISNGCPVRSDAVDNLIALAKTASPEKPIYVIGLACATNLASALLLDPSIRENVVMTWTAGYPTNVTDIANSSFNLAQDVAAAQILFTCGVPLVYLPGFYIGQQFTLSSPDIEQWIQGSGPLGSFLADKYYNNPLFKWYGIDPNDLTGRIWNIWDVVNAAWLIEPGAVSSRTVVTPLLNDDLYWVPDPSGQPMTEGTYAAYNAFFPAFVKRLKDFGETGM